MLSFITVAEHRLDLQLLAPSVLAAGGLSPARRRSWSLSALHEEHGVLDGRKDLIH